MAAEVIHLTPRATAGERWAPTALRMLEADERVLAAAMVLADVADDPDDATAAYLQLRSAAMERRAAYLAAGAVV